MLVSRIARIPACLALGLLLVSGRPATAAGPRPAPAGPLHRVNDRSRGDQGFPTVASNKAGDVLIVWDDISCLTRGVPCPEPSPDGSGAGVFARWRHAAGDLGPVFQVNESAVGNQFAPAVAMAPDGSFVVAWLSFPGGTTGSVVARRFDREGLPLSGDIRVDDPGFSLGIGAPAVALRADGAFAVTWGDSDAQAQTEPNISIRFFDGSGSPMTGVQRVNAAADIHQQPAVAVGEDGSFLVVWRRWVAGHPRADIRARLYGPDGAPRAKAFAVYTLREGVVPSHPAVVGLPGGGFFAVWGENADNFVTARRIEAGGSVVAPLVRVSRSRSEIEPSPALAVGHGEVLVVWDTHLGLLARRFDLTGLPLSPELGLPFLRNGYPILPKVAPTAGAWDLVWQGRDADGSGVFERSVVLP
jgi:hypothetical protein